LIGGDEDYDFSSLLPQQGPRTSLLFYFSLRSFVLVGLDSWPRYPSTTYLYLYGLCTLSLSLNTCMFDKKNININFHAYCGCPIASQQNSLQHRLWYWYHLKQRGMQFVTIITEFFFCEEFHHHNRVNCVVEQNRRKRLKSSHQMLINCIP